MIDTVTRPCKLQDPEEVRQIIDEYFREREEKQEVRELKNGDKRVYRTPPSIYSLCKKLGITEELFSRWTSESRDDVPKNADSQICELLTDAKKRIIEELYEGLALEYWNERLILAQLTKFGIIGSEEQDKHVTIRIQGSDSWSE